MYCPTCKQEFEHCYEPLHGVHVDYHCPCGQLLQWDYPLTSPTSSVYLIGIPAPCTHPDRRQSAALFPRCAL
jgi:hypothetical protein